VGEGRGEGSLPPLPPLLLPSWLSDPCHRFRSSEIGAPLRIRCHWSRATRDSSALRFRRNAAPDCCQRPPAPRARLWNALPPPSPSVLTACPPRRVISVVNSSDFTAAPQFHPHTPRHRPLPRAYLSQQQPAQRPRRPDRRPALVLPSRAGRHGVRPSRQFPSWPPHCPSAAAGPGQRGAVHILDSAPAPRSACAIHAISNSASSRIRCAAPIPVATRPIGVILGTGPVCRSTVLHRDRCARMSGRPARGWVRQGQESPQSVVQCATRSVRVVRGRSAPASDPTRAHRRQCTGAPERSPEESRR